MYNVASELIDQIQDIEEIRKGQVSNNLAELDDSLSRLQKCVFHCLCRCIAEYLTHLISDLDRIIRQCEKRVDMKSSYRKRIVGMFTVDKVKAEILELKAQVASAQMRFLVRSAVPPS